MMIVFGRTARYVVLSFVKVDFGRPSAPLQPLGQAPGHFDGPGSVGCAVAEKERAFVSLDFDRCGGQKIDRRAAPRPGPLSGIPNLPAWITAVAPVFSIERTTNYVCRTMGGNRIRFAVHVVACHEGCQQQGVLGTTRHAVNPNFLPSRRKGTQGRKRIDCPVERHIDDVTRIPGIAAIGIAERKREKSMRGKQNRVPMTPSRPCAFRAMENHDCRKRAIASRSVSRSPIGYKTAQDS